MPAARCEIHSTFNLLRPKMTFKGLVYIKHGNLFRGIVQTVLIKAHTRLLHVVSASPPFLLPIKEIIFYIIPSYTGSLVLSDVQSREVNDFTILLNKI